MIPALFSGLFDTPVFWMFFRPGKFDEHRALRETSLSDYFGHLYCAIGPCLVALLEPVTVANPVMDPMQEMSSHWREEA